MGDQLGILALPLNSSIQRTITDTGETSLALPRITSGMCGRGSGVRIGSNCFAEGGGQYY